MTVEVIPRELEYYTLEVKTRTDVDGREYLTWDYGNATYFVILKMSADFDLNNVNSPEFFSLLKNGIERCFTPTGQIFDGEVDFDYDKKLQLISLNQFIRTGKFHYDPYPMKVVVLSVERRGETLRVHVPDDIMMSATFIPAKVIIEVRRSMHEQRKGGLFGGFKKQVAPSWETYQVKVSNLNQLYKDGVFYYIQGYKTRYPVTQDMSSKQFTITTPPGRRPEFGVEKAHLQDYVLNVKYY